MQIPHVLTIQLKLLALKALPAIEQKALDYLRANQQKLGDKRGLAVDYVMKQYTAIEATIPGLSATTIDDDIIRQQATAAVDWAWGKMGDTINAVVHDPVNNDPTLPASEDTK